MSMNGAVTDPLARFNHRVQFRLVVLENRYVRRQLLFPPRVLIVADLRESNGAPMTSVVSVRFAVYRDQSDGAPIWSEVQNVQPDPQGRYAVLLGAYSDGGLPIDLFSASESRWLGVQTNGPGSAEQPR